MMTPTWEPIWLACKGCRHEWDDWQPAMVPVATWVAHVRTYHCPNCGKGGRNVLIRRHPLAPLGMAVIERGTA